MNPTGIGAKIKHKKGDKHGMVTLTGNREKRHTTYWYEATCKCGATIWLSLPGLTYLAGCASCRGWRTRLRQIRSDYRSPARLKGRVFELSQEQFNDLVMAPCKYCGDKDFPLGVDRVDNSKGYTLDNCVPCCGMCNKAKSNKPLEYFLAWVSRVYQHSGKQ